ncbi:hypothetical protein KY336_03245 [Candidatus Woesearchaeota archaeon]|nr:hypothetical protein [Candidatus Woesearchaeota archaeon]
MDVSKIREKGEMAKNLVARGIAANMEEAHKMIDSKGMVRTDMQLQPEQEKAMEEIKVDEQVDQIANGNNGILKRVEQLEQMLQQFKEFFNKYKNNNDNNLKELDSSIKMMMRKLERGAVTNAPQQSQPAEQQTQQQEQPAQQQPAQQEKPQSNTQAQAPGTNLDQSQFSVEKIFNNSNGRMMKNKK